MKDKHFEDIVRKEFENFEIQPNEGLFDKVMSARQGRTAIPVAFFSTKSIVLLATGLFLATSWIVIKSTDFNNHADLNNSIVASTNNLEEVNLIEDNFTTETSESLINEIELDVTNYPNNNLVKNNSLKVTSPVKKTESSSNVSKRLVKTVTENQQLNSGKKEAITTEDVVFVGATVNTYPLSFRTVDKGFNELYTEQIFFTHYNSESDNVTPVIYKKPRLLRNYWVNNLELGVGIGTWNLPKGSYAEGYRETMPVSFNAHARTRIKISQNLSILTGLAFNRRQSVYSYNSSESKEEMNIDTVNGFIIDPGAPPIPVTTYDTSYSTMVNNYSGKGRNVYSRFSIPIGVEYNKTFKQNYMYANAGVLVNIMSYSNGAWLSEESFQIQNFKGKSNQLSSSISTGYFAGIGYGYKLNSRFTLLFEGNVSAWNISKNPIGESSKNLIINTGLSTGIKWNF